MSVRYTIIKKTAYALRTQKLMAQPYHRLQRIFRTRTAKPQIPKISDPDFDCSVFTAADATVLYIKHKSPVQGVCVYVAGGGMLFYPRKKLAKKMTAYARLLGRDMILPYYPLCPAHNLADVYDMLYELYKKLLAGYSVEAISFLGESSGGNHAVGLLSHINAMGEGLPLPGKVYVSSQGTMYCYPEELEAAKRLDKTDFVMSRKALDTIFDGMTAGMEVPEYMRYLQKGDYRGLQEIYLCFGGDELFSAAADSIKKRMEECGAKVTLEVGKGLYHCYPLAPYVPEAKQGYENMIRFLKRDP